MLDFTRKMVEFGMIKESDTHLIYATDSVDEAIAHIRDKAIKPFGLTLVTHPRRSWPWLGEKSISTHL